MITVIGNKPIMNVGDNEIGVVGDHLFKTLEFSIDRVQGAIDLNDYSAWGLIERSVTNGGTSYSTSVTKTTEGDKITISLPITANETKDYGYIYASIKFATANPITAVADYSGTVAGTVKVTSASHGLSSGVTTGVVISGTTNYNGTYDVTYINANEFYFTHAWVSTQTGWWGISPVWQTQRVLLKVAKGINGETEADALEVSVFDNQVAIFQGYIDDLESINVNYPTIEDMVNAIDDIETTTLDAINATAAANSLAGSLIVNGVTNGSFESDGTGWDDLVTNTGTVSYDTVQHVVGAKSIKFVTSAKTCIKYQEIDCSTGDKFYISGWVRRESGTGCNFYALPKSATTGTIASLMAPATFDAMTADTWTRYSTIATTNNGGIRIVIGRTSNQTYTAEFDGLIAINLTTLFCAGLEPTVAEFEALMAYFTSYWFDGAALINQVQLALIKEWRLSKTQLATLVGIPERVTDVEAAVTQAGMLDLLDLENPYQSKSLTNLITNGDFTTAGTTGWIVSSGCTKANTDNKLIVTGTGASEITSVYFSFANNTLHADDYIYISCKFTARSSLVTSAYALLTSTNNTTQVIQLTPVEDTEYSYHGIKKMSSSATTGDCYILFCATYANTTDATGAVCEWDDICVINLTQGAGTPTGTDVFGAGNEPLIDLMNIVIDEFTTGSYYFEGTQTVPIGVYSEGKFWVKNADGTMALKTLGELQDETPLDLTKLLITDTYEQFATDNVDAALKEIKTQVDSVGGEGFDLAFTITDEAEEIQDLVPVSNPVLIALGSTFSGWGAPIGAPQDFNTLVFQIKNRAGNEPITQIRAMVFIGTKAGTVVVSVLKTDYNIAAGETETVYFPLGDNIPNAGAEELWACFKCNKTIDHYGGTTAWYFDGTTHPRTGYATGGSVAETTMTASTVSYDKALLYVCNMRQALSPTIDFIDRISPVPVRVILPTQYNAVVGDTFQLFYRGVVEAVNPYNYNIEFIYVGDNGRAYPRYFQITPQSGDIGTHLITINIRDNRDTLIGTGSCNLVISAPLSNPAAMKNVLCIGDSLTYDGNWVTEAERRLMASDGTPVGLSWTNVNFIGTVTGGKTAREGHSGWSWATYIGATSPFYIGGKLDFAAYCTANEYDGIDYAYILLTWNASGAYRDLASNNQTAVNNGKIFIDALHADYPNAKVKLMGIQVPSLCGGIGRDYTGVADYYNAYGLTRTVMGLNLAYQDWCNEAGYSDFMEFINISGQFDSENNMSSVATPVNTRNPATELLGTGASTGIHPNLMGYLQIGDAAYRNMAVEIT